MLNGAGAYAGLGARIGYDPGFYAQIAAAAVQVWKALPNKAEGDKLSQILQGPSEPFQDFASWLLQLAGKLFRVADHAMPIITQLALKM